jgi:UDP-N-acetylglucosamine 2-epimerase (non-hydrolysing)
MSSSQPSPLATPPELDVDGHRNRMKRKISFIFGTRPEAIKLAPLILAMREHPDLEPLVCVTGQHRQMLDQVLNVFGIVPDVDLDLMQPNQTLGQLTSHAIAAIDAYLGQTNPDLVLVQGDTTTVLCATLCAFYHKISVGHVEAGLRTGNLRAPWPEEANRVLASRIATLHFAPTQAAHQNLLNEGVPENRVFVTGNTIIDALFIALEKIKQITPVIEHLPANLQPGTESSGPRMVLITGHRRENFGHGFENICQAAAELAHRFPSVHFVYPVHLNPNVREPVMRMLGQGNSPKSGPQLTNVHLHEPLSYLPFIALMNRSHLILTDSGGVQEEAPSLGKPVLVMRDTTERPEAVAMGTAKLVGAETATIVDNVSTLLTNHTAYSAMAKTSNPYGDGQAAKRILDICARAFAGQ